MVVVSSSKIVINRLETLKSYIVPDRLSGQEDPLVQKHRETDRHPVTSIWMLSIINGQLCENNINKVQTLFVCSHTSLRVHRFYNHSMEDGVMRYFCFRCDTKYESSEALVQHMKECSSFFYFYC